MLHGRDVDTENALIARQEAEKQAAAQAETERQASQVEWLRQNAPQYAGLVENGFMAPTDVGRQLTAQSEPAQDPAAIAEYKFYANEEMKAGRPPVSFLDWKQGGGAAKPISYGVTPIWGQFDDGTTGYGVQGSDGSFKRVDTGGMTPLDPRTLASEKAAGSAFGKGQGGAVLDLPQAQWTADETIKEIDALMVHPGIDEQFGGFLNSNQVLPAFPGTYKADFQTRLSQAQGRTFLQAYEMLRGGGQITEVEGKKAEQAMARLSTSQTKAAFLEALRDFKDAVRAGLDKLQQQATMSPFPPATTGGNQTSTGVQWSIAP